MLFSKICLFTLTFFLHEKKMHHNFFDSLKSPIVDIKDIEIKAKKGENESEFQMGIRFLRKEKKFLSF